MMNRPFGGVVAAALLALAANGLSERIVAAGQTGTCARGAPLTQSEIEEWVKNQLPEATLSETLASCGATCILDADSAEALRTLGAGEKLLALLAPPDHPAQGQGWTPPIDGREMVWVSAGSFLMGSADTEAGRDPDEEQHKVEIAAGFWLDVAEVTNEAYQRFILANPAWQKGRTEGDLYDARYLQDWAGTDFPAGTGDDPLVYVSWHAARAYAAWVGKRLPTEAEWEYAARAGTTSLYWWGDEFDSSRVRSDRFGGRR